MLTTQQKAALNGFRRFTRNPHEQVFNLWGAAGTGKTTLAAKIARESDGRVLVATLTNKAAKVLRDKGLPQAQTIHSLMYEPVEDDSGKVWFVRKEVSDLECADLLILDETSMIDADMADDLLHYGVKTLALGDPFQLPPPVNGRTSYFTEECEGDYFLDEIVRQAADSPVLALATRVREGKSLKAGAYGDSVVLKGGLEFDTKDWDQIIVGLHSTRCAFNVIYRQEDSLPKRGDVVMCKSNDRDLGLINGDQWTVEACSSKTRDMVVLDLRDGRRRVSVQAWSRGFTGVPGWRELEAMPWRNRQRYATFIYGYAITAHSAQGSEWPAVVIRNEPPGRTDPARWLYTAITRAQERVMVSM